MFSIIIPTYNEELSLKNDNFLISLEEELKKSELDEYEIIVVNDGSTDATLEILKSINSDKIKILDNYINKGYGSSIKRGIINSRFDVIVIVDMDGTYPAKNVPEAIKKYLDFQSNKNNIDMVVAQRTGKHYRESYIKSILRYILRFIVDGQQGIKYLI